MLMSILRYLRSAKVRSFVSKSWKFIIKVSRMVNGLIFMTLGDRISSLYVVGNLISSQRKKHHTVSRLSIEVEFKAMAKMTCELVWLGCILYEFGFKVSYP